MKDIIYSLFKSNLTNYRFFFTRVTYAILFIWKFLFITKTIYTNLLNNIGIFSQGNSVMSKSIEVC